MSHLRELLKRNRFKVFWTWASRFWPNLIGAVLAAYGMTTLLWVFQLTLHDIITWGKDIPLIFFDSRTDEYKFPTMGIDMRVIHYFLIGLALLLLGLIVLFRRWSKLSPKVADYTVVRLQKRKPLAKSPANKEKDPSGCSHHFGYLSSLPNDEAVPQECTKCQKLVECRNLI